MQLITYLNPVACLLPACGLWPACYRPVAGHTDIKYADESLKIATKQIGENLSVLILKSKNYESGKIPTY